MVQYQNNQINQMSGMKRKFSAIEDKHKATIQKQNEEIATLRKEKAELVEKLSKCRELLV